MSRHRQPRSTAAGGGSGSALSRFGRRPLTEEGADLQQLLESYSESDILDLLGRQRSMFGLTDLNGLPALPGQLGPDDDLIGQVSTKDRNRIRKMRRMRKSMSGRQGTILGKGVPTAPGSSSQSLSVLGT